MAYENADMDTIALESADGTRISIAAGAADRCGDKGQMRMGDGAAFIDRSPEEI